MVDKKTQGKKNRQAGQRFEVKVRKDLESKGWIVDRWSNNVKFIMEVQPIKVGVKENKEVTTITVTEYERLKGKLVPAKSMFNMRTTGFPDFIVYGKILDKEKIKETSNLKKCKGSHLYHIIGVEVKSNGYLDPSEREKCKWLLANKTFSKILIASKGTKRGQIVYKEFK